MKQKLFGVVPPIITPVDEYERVDEKGLRLLIDHCIDHGIHGIFVCGSNGECMALTQAERDRAIRIALDECAGRVPVIAGVMDSSTKRVIENVKRFEDMGGQTAVVTPVFYARHATQDETVRHFEDISAATEADLMIYNIPMFTGQNLTADTVIRISQIDRVTGVRESPGYRQRHEVGSDPGRDMQNLSHGQKPDSLYQIRHEHTGLYGQACDPPHGAHNR